jgi:hypothetical protein
MVKLVMMVTMVTTIRLGHGGHWRAPVACPARVRLAVDLGRMSKVTVPPGLGDNITRGKGTA